MPAGEAMRVLLIKTSSMGDVIHTLPALTDAAAARPGLQFDWVVEEAFAPIAGWHPAVAEVIPIGFRRWRRQPVRALAGGALTSFRAALGARRYDAVIDAQGLYKSAAIAAMARGPRHGLGFGSSRERLVPLVYQHRHAVPRDRHAIDRVRQLFAAALGYAAPDGEPDYGIDRARLSAPVLPDPYLVFLHGSAWRTKLWTVDRWRGLAGLAGAAGHSVALLWHGDEDRRRAEAIARDNPHVSLFRLDHDGVAGALAGARGVVAVETGFSHLAAALGVPTVTIYGPTGPQRHGTRGRNQLHMPADYPCAPCYKRICGHTGNLRQPAACMASVAERAVWRSLTILGVAADAGAALKSAEGDRDDAHGARVLG